MLLNINSISQKKISLPLNLCSKEFFSLTEQHKLNPNPTLHLFNSVWLNNTTVLTNNTIVFMKNSTEVKNNTTVLMKNTSEKTNITTVLMKNNGEKTNNTTVKPNNSLNKSIFFINHQNLSLCQH